MDRENGESPGGDSPAPEIDEIDAVFRGEVRLYLLGVTAEEVEEADQFPKPPAAMSSAKASA